MEANQNQGMTRLEIVLWGFSTFISLLSLTVELLSWLLTPDKITGMLNVASNNWHLGSIALVIGAAIWVSVSIVAIIVIQMTPEEFAEKVSNKFGWERERTTKLINFLHALTSPIAAIFSIAVVIAISYFVFFAPRPDPVAADSSVATETPSESETLTPTPKREITPTPEAAEDDVPDTDTNTPTPLAELNPEMLEQIIFVSKRDTNFDIYKIDAKGDSEINLTRSGLYDYQPAVSPDGEQIAFTSNRDGNQGIYLMNTDGSEQTLLGPYASSEMPTT